MSVHRLVPSVGAARREIAAALAATSHGIGEAGAYAAWLRLSDGARELVGYEAWRRIAAAHKENVRADH